MTLAVGPNVLSTAGTLFPGGGDDTGDVAPRFMKNTLMENSIANTFSAGYAFICIPDRIAMNPEGKNPSISHARSTSLSMPTTSSSARGFCSVKSFLMQSRRADSVASIIPQRTMPSSSKRASSTGSTFASL